MQKKELLRIICSTKTWIVCACSLLLPLLLSYLLFYISGWLLEQTINNESKATYQIAWIAEGENAQVLKDRLELHLQIKLIEDYKEVGAELMQAIQSDSINAAVVVDADFDANILKQKQGIIQLHYKNPSSKAVDILEDFIQDYENQLIAKNLDSLNIPKNLLTPIRLQERNYFSIAKMLDSIFVSTQKTIAILLVFLCFIFGSIAARYVLKLILWEEAEADLSNLLASSGVSKVSIFRAKICWGTAFVWKNMLLALLGFVLALSFEQEGIIQNLMIQLREFLSWGKILLFVVFALPLAFLLFSTYILVGFFITFWREFGQNILFITLFTLFIVGAVSNLGLYIPYANYTTLGTVIIQSSLSWFEPTVTIMISLILGIVFCILSYYKFQTRALLRQD